MLKGEYEVLGELKGKEMEGWTYDGPFDDLPAANTPGGVTHLKKLVEVHQDHRSPGPSSDPVG